MPEDNRPYHVIVLFKAGCGDRFASKQDALEYAEQEMHRLLGEEEEAEQGFEGIFCEHIGTHELWRFEYEDGRPVWIIEHAAPEDEVRATNIFGEFES